MEKNSFQNQKWPKKIGVMVLAILFLTLIIIGFYFLGFYPHRNNIYEDLDSGVLKVDKIQTLTFISSTNSLAVPWTQKGYSELESTVTKNSGTVREFAKIIIESSLQGYSRPGTRGASTTKNYTRIDVVDGFYYILSTEVRYADSTTIEYLALPKNSTNPNTAKAYSNIQLVDFFKKNDPYYFE